jgi:hypothetical protein
MANDPRCQGEGPLGTKASNPTIFDHAIKNSVSDDAAIREKLREGKSGEQ